MKDDGGAAFGLAPFTKQELIMALENWWQFQDMMDDGPDDSDIDWAQRKASLGWEVAVRVHKWIAERAKGK